MIHAGQDFSGQGKALNQGPVFSSTFHLSGDPESGEYQYGRFNNPTWQSLENAISELEHADSVVFPSGMAAIAGVMNGVLRSGNRLVLQSDGYFATRAYADEFLKPNGIKVEVVKTRDLLDYDYESVDLVLVESPSNPMLDVVDIKALADVVHSSGGKLAIDNTTLTSLGQQPLILGADISLCAATKVLNGHSDVLFGYVASTDESVIERIRLWRKLAGNIPGPMETWLVHRGMATLDMRLKRMCENALAIAQELSAHPQVLNVRYPGLPTDPSFEIAKRQMTHFGFIVSFDLGGQEKADKFLSNLKMIYEATSFGGVHSIAERRARWGTDDVSQGLIRLSVGCEDIEDIKSDMLSALAQSDCDH